MAFRRGRCLKLPDGFEAKHSKENTASDQASDFCTSRSTSSWQGKVHEAVIALLGILPQHKLDEPSPEHFRSMFPTMGSMFILIADSFDDACRTDRSDSQRIRETGCDLKTPHCVRSEPGNPSRRDTP